jgi:ATP-dependent protease ClpP protease subunit
MDIESLFSTPKHSVWDNYVPIVTNKNITTVYLTDVIESPSEYNQLCYKLDTASEAEKFFIHINTPGGILDAAIMLVNSIRNTKAHTVARLSGTVASAGTIITLACQEVEIAPHTAFMIHNYSGGLIGKGHELKAHQEFVDSNLNKSFTDFYGGFLTPHEIRQVIDGKDLWMGAEEVQKRLAKKAEIGSLPTIEDTLRISTRGRPRKVK